MKKKNVELVDIMTGFGYKKTNAEAILHTPPSAKGYMRLRDWGIECMHVLMPHNLMIMNSPTGSGKSVVGATIIQQKLEYDNKLKAIIAVPETLIGKGFTNEKKIELVLEDGKIKIPFVWNPQYNLCTESGFDSKADELIDFVKRPVINRKGESIFSEDFNERVLVCCHQTLILAYNKLFGADVDAKQKKENTKIWNNLLIAVDEAHALQGGADDEEGYLPESPNYLGNLVVKTSEDSKKQNNHVLLITATFFRGDRKALLPESILSQFARFDLPYDIWLNQMKWFKGFTYDFVVGARDVADPNDYFEGYRRSFRSLVASNHTKIIAYVPHRSNRMATGDKYAEVRHLLDIMKKELGCHAEDPDSKTGVISLIGKKPDGTLFAYKVLDLVDEEMRNKKKDYFSDDEINKNPDALDCILALDMFKEGCDWEYANGMIITGIKNSLTEVIQMIGRLLRDKEGKPTAKIMHLLPFSPAAMPMDDNLNQFFKCIGLSLLMEHIYNPVRIEIKEKKKGGGGSSGSTPPPPVFDNLSLDENQRNKIITGVQEELVKYAGELQEIKGTYTPQKLREKMPEIMEKLLADEGITLSEEDLRQASDEIYFLFPRRTLEMQRINVDDITWKMLEEADPIEFMLKYVSRECNKEALAELRRIIAGFETESNHMCHKVCIFVVENGKEPKSNSKNPEEKKMGTWLLNRRQAKKLRKRKDGKISAKFYQSDIEIAKLYGLETIFETKDPERESNETTMLVADFYKKHKRYPIKERESKEEKFLGSWQQYKIMARYGTTKGTWRFYQSDLQIAIREGCPDMFDMVDDELNSSLKVEKICLFFQTNGKWPNMHAEGEELKLAQFLNCKRRGMLGMGTYKIYAKDLEVAKKYGLEKVIFEQPKSKKNIEINSAKKIEIICIFYQKNKRYPSQKADIRTATGKEERKLGGFLSAKRMAKKTNNGKLYSMDIEVAKKYDMITMFDMKEKIDHNKIKNELLSMAKKGLPRPHYRSELGKSLTKYTAESQHQFNTSFNSKIRKIAPDWFK